MNTRHNTRHSFENSVPWDSTAIIPQTTYYGDSVIGASIESQVKIPLFQSVITGVFIGTGIGISVIWLASLINIYIPWYTAIPGSIFFYTGFDWLRRSTYFNQLLQPEIEIEEAEIKVSQRPPIEINVTNEGQHGIKRRPIESASNKQIVEWAKAIKLDFRTGGLPDLTQVRFSGSGKIFSQPAYAEFQKELLELGLTEKINPSSKNSPYKLSQAGYNFVNKITSDYNLIGELLDN